MQKAIANMNKDELILVIKSQENAVVKKENIIAEKENAIAEKEIALSKNEEQISEYKTEIEYTRKNKKRAEHVK